MLSKELGEKTTKALYKEIPEFETYAAEYLDEDFIHGYLVMDCFGSFLKRIIKQDVSPELIDRCYAFINQLCESRNKDIEEWLAVTFLESMVERGKAVQLSRLKLKGMALILFEEVISGPMFDGGKHLE